MNKLIIDINCDVGEGLENEAELFPFISRCNIACGGHAGDEKTIRDVVRLAKSYQIKIGAHPSYPDKENFGRKVLDIDNDLLEQSLVYQISTFKAIAEQENVEIDHLKPHGALYNEVAKNEKLALMVIDVLKRILPGVKLMAPYHSVIAKQAALQKIELIFEGFVDRNYEEDLSLVSRNKPNAIIAQKEKALDHVVRMAKGKVVTVTGKEKKIRASSFCIHGDHKNTLEILQYLYEKMPEQGIYISK